MIDMYCGVAENRLPGKKPVCIWCDRSLDLEVPHKGRVCTRCYRLLKLAGISEDEIFGRDEQNDLNTPSSSDDDGQNTLDG